jgi:hypothetical protein
MGKNAEIWEKSKKARRYGKICKISKTRRYGKITRRYGKIGKNIINAEIWENKAEIWEKTRRYGKILFFTLRRYGKITRRYECHPF